MIVRARVVIKDECLQLPQRHLPMYLYKNAFTGEHYKTLHEGSSTK